MTKVLVSGGTGAIGRRLVPTLLDRGYDVRVLSRSRSGFDTFGWADDVEIATGDVGDWVSLDAAMRGTDVAYYLVHGMDASVRDLVDREEKLATVFRDVAEMQGLEQIITLGGLFPEEELARLSPHMYARQRSGAILRRGPVAGTELRAAIVISRESASFRLLQAAAKMPVVIAQPWMASRCQPIGIDDVIHYLVGVLGAPRAYGEVLEIGGPDVLTYHQMIRVYLEVTGGAWRPSIPTPAGPPELAAPFAAKLAGVDVELALPLLTSARRDAVVTDHRIDEIVPHDPLHFEETIRRALAADPT
ncbi:MAG: NAD(P)H-binding protein [Nitriliruptorales bacterium]|nr:NAD(P)H-binding protein [Nitriliruptorales bacterium]